MILESSEGIEHYLLEHRNFEECILQSVQWHHFGTVIDLVFDYIWDVDGSIKPGNAPEVKTLRFRNVQELHVCNALNESMVLSPGDLTWGLSEVASVERVIDETEVAKYKHLPIPIYHLRCRWEGARQIDVIFGTLEVS